VARHAGPATATVLVTYGVEDVTVQVDDDGRRPGARQQPAAGSGIAGMRERVAALGGEFFAGPRQGGGFRVRARLPLNGTAGSGSCSLTTRSWSGPGSALCSTPRTTSRWSARPATGTRPCA
jgi:signal transduction histidine kinase